jgi:hypothetical protein
MDSVEAETKVREFIKQKYPRLESTSFQSMYREGDAWVLEGTVEYKRIHFFLAARAFMAQVNMNTGAVTSYRVQPNPKKI